MNAVKRNTLILAGLWIAIKLFLYYKGIATDNLRLVVTLNFAFIVFLVYTALQSFYQKQHTSTEYVEDLKVALGGGLRYVLIIFGFLIVYYIFIHKEFPQEMAHMQVENTVRPGIEAEGSYENFLEKYKEELKDVENLPSTADEYCQNIEDDLATSLPMSLVLPGILMGLFFMSLAVSTLGAAVFKKFMPSLKNQQ